MMNQSVTPYKMANLLLEIEKAAQGDPEALKVVCRFAAESVRTDIREVEDKTLKEALNIKVSQIMADLRDESSSSTKS